MIGFKGLAMVLHILVSVVLIVVVLLQSQQSMNLSGLMGGASQSALGSQPQSVLSKVTTGLAIVFFLTATFFALVPAQKEGALTPGKVTAPPSGEKQPAGSQSEGAGGEAPGESPQSTEGAGQAGPAQPEKTPSGSPQD